MCNDAFLNDGPASISELAEAVAWQGFAIADGRRNHFGCAALEMDTAGASAGPRALWTGLVLVVPSTESTTRPWHFATKQVVAAGPGHIDASQTS